MIRTGWPLCLVGEATLDYTNSGTFYTDRSQVQDLAQKQLGALVAGG
jgi:hypothetical protein